MDGMTPVFGLMMHDAEIFEWEGKFKKEERSLTIKFKEKEINKTGNKTRYNQILICILER
jgi:hypothetical protein